MNLWQRVRTALKALTVQFPARQRRLSSLLVPNSVYDYRRAVGDGRGSSVVMASVLWIARTFPEAPIIVEQRGSGTQRPHWAPAIEHPLPTLLMYPNPHYGGNTLLHAVLADLHTDGNAYLIKVRARAGDVVQLWWIPAFMIEPAYPEDASTTFIEHYEYKPDPRQSKKIKIPKEDIVHFRYGLDPDNMRKGQSPLSSLLREIFTDEEAANFTAALLRNLGIPGVVISPADAEVEADDDDLEEVKQTFMRRYGGDHRGEPIVMRTKTEISILSFSPQQLMLKDLRRIPEERVTAVLGIPAIVVGLGAGLDRSTFANFAEAREAAFESNIAPLQRLIAQELTLQLLEMDFGGVRNQHRVNFDNTLVSILQEQRNRRADRLALLFKEGLMTRGEVRMEMGYHVGPADEVYRIPKTVLEVPADQGATHLTEQQLASGSGGFGDEPAVKQNGHHHDKAIPALHP